ncbi:MAG: hypothetical protein FJ190_11665 [Gammaproteobacteria bacterium]|nr:hypothetical protein [Gammaproteobacteria bacterium]
MNNFAQLISCKKKKDLEKFCKSESVSSPEFADFIAACMSGTMPLNHAMKYFDYVPPHLETRDEDWTVLNSRNASERTPDENRVIRRIFKTHAERKYRVGHMFFSKELSHPIKEWHFAFFELDELEDLGNHWVNSSHIHFVNCLWPKLYCQDIWNDFVLHKRFPSAKLHVKYTNRVT